jgi:formylmethanofuran dehydrogenase subunit E
VIYPHEISRDCELHAVLRKQLEPSMRRMFLVAPVVWLQPGEAAIASREPCELCDAPVWLYPAWSKVDLLVCAPCAYAALGRPLPEGVGVQA